GDCGRLPARVEGAQAHFNGFSTPVANPDGVQGEAVAWFRTYEAGLAAAGSPGVPVTVLDVLDKGAVVIAECRADDGGLFEAQFSRGALPELARPGERASLMPQRVFVFR